VSERFNDFHERIEATSTTDRLDDEEFTFTVRQFRLAVCKVVHRYAQQSAVLRGDGRRG
jgi:hypothetical protein